jgi:hypothetical protein
VEMNVNPRLRGAMVLVVMGLAWLDQTTTLRLLGTLQSLVIIILGMTATLYLWKRM